MSSGLHLAHFLFLLILCALGQLGSSAARIRVSVRSSSRISSSSSSTRSYGFTRGTSFSTLSLLVSNRFSYRASRMAYTRGIIFSTASWRYTHSDYAAGTTICFNVMTSLPAEYNSSVVEPWLYQGRLVYGLFVCPMEVGRPDRTYCCGTEDTQWCCSFWEEPGRVAGLFVGLILGIALSSFIGYKVYRKYGHKCKKDGEGEPEASPTPEAGHSAPLGIGVNYPLSAAELQPSSTTHPGQADTQGYNNPSFKQPAPPGYGYELQQPQQLENPPYPGFVLPPPYFEAGTAAQTGPMPPVTF